LDLGAYAFGAKQYQPNNQDLQQKTYLDKTWIQKSENKQVGMVEAMNFRLDASYQLDANNSIGANFGFLRNPKQTCDANMTTAIWQDEDQTLRMDFLFHTCSGCHTVCRCASNYRKGGQCR
jgi:hypothetical protein